MSKASPASTSTPATPAGKAPPSSTPTDGAHSGGAGLLRRALAIPEVGILLPLLGLTLFFYWRSPVLLSPENIGSMLRAMSFVGVVAVGLTLLMIAGEIDLSVGSVAGLCAIVASHLMKDAGWPVLPSLLAGLGTGALAGLINGLLVVRLGIPAFIATLGMLYIARGGSFLISKGYPLYPLPASVESFGAANTLGTSSSFVIFILLAVAADVFLRRMVVGRMIYATGGNAEAARLAGVNTSGVKIACFVLTGLLAALGGLLIMARFNVGRPETGTGWELEVIAAVVIGGVSLFGGSGSMIGTLCGLAIMQIVRSGLVISQVNTHWQTVALGVIMIAAVGVDLLRRRARLS